MFDRLCQWIEDLFAGWMTPRPDPSPDPAPTPGPSPEPIPAPRPAPPVPSHEAQVVDAINAARASEGLSPLVDDRVLGGMARAWAASMASDEVLSHGDFAGRITATYPNVAAGEDIAEGQPDATSVVDDWMASPPHRANILGDFDRLGVGSASDEAGTIYWCADFVQIN